VNLISTDLMTFQIIPLAFLTTIANPTLNFANAGDKCTAISGSNLFYCSELE
jgi:chitinase